MITIKAIAWLTVLTLIGLVVHLIWFDEPNVDYPPGTNIIKVNMSEPRHLSIVDEGEQWGFAIYDNGVICQMGDEVLNVASDNSKLLDRIGDEYE